MKILLLTDGVFPFVIGGMQKHSYYLAKYLTLQEHDITLVHAIPHNKPIPTRAEVLQAMNLPENVSMEVLGFGFPKPGQMPGHYLKASYLYSRKTYDHLKERLHEFDFIYAKGFCGWHFLHEKTKGKTLPPVGVKFHGYEMFQPTHSMKTRLQAWMLRGPVKWNNLHADFVFSYGGQITQLILNLGVARERVIEVPTGIEASWCLEQLPVRQHPPVRFLFVGRYEERKGINEIHASLEELKELSGFEFHFIGPIPQSKRLSMNQVVYHGEVKSQPEIQRVMDQCDVLVAPSHSEGMPNVIMEGMARGLAVLTTAVGAIPAVVDSNNGWMIQPGNSADLTKSIRKIVQLSVVELSVLQQNSLLKIAHFHWEKTALFTARQISMHLS